MSVPDWYEALLLALAAYRIFRLLAEDSVLDTPRRRLLRLSRDWEEGQDLPAEYRDKIALFIRCVWCLGWWVCLAWWGLWQIWPTLILFISAPLVFSTVAGVIRRNLDPPDE